MKQNDAHHDLPEKLPLKQLLGLKDGTDFDWGQIRAMQFEGLQNYQLISLFAPIICAVTVVFTYLGTINPLLLGGWLLAIIIAHSWNYTRARGAALWTRKQVTTRETTVYSFRMLVIGTLWTAGFFIFARSGDIASMLVVWALILALTVGQTMIMSSVPLGCIGFLFPTTVGTSVSLFMNGQVEIALTAAVVGLLMTGACIVNARAYIERKLAEANLVEKNEVVSLLLREFEDTGADWLWQTDTSRRFTHVSPRLAHALGRPAEEIEGKPLLQMVAGESWNTGKFAAALHDLAERLKRRDSFSNMLVPVVINGETRWWELSASPKMDESGTFLGFRGVGSDVTAQRESAEKISHMARFDTLTGLPNRLQLTETLAKVIADAEKWSSRCGFMMIDLDRFKAVNDTLGHPVGDRLLARVSERLRSIMSSNELCGRLGGDEFAIVIKDANDSGYINKLAKAIIETLSRPYEVDQHTLFIGASIGTAVGPRDGRTVEMLMRSADLALYRSKDDGGGAHNNYEPKLHVHAEERRVMEIALRKSLDNNEMSLNYQPVVSADTGGVVGFEALIRWNSPEFGPVSPVKFIPLAEEARLIVPIGAWVMRTACKEAMNWPPSVKVAVNVSADQLTDPNFQEMVVRALQESGLPAHRLEIEVTESIFMREGTGATNVLDNIIALGVNLSLDDFGTGYSSLGYLRKTRFNTIKVDRSFVQGAAKQIPESLAIIRAVVAMADALGMSTTAEGAETEAEVKMIQQLGCRKIQGYYFGRPMSADDTRELFRQAKHHDFTQRNVA